jgi:hypothetical protein
MISLTTPIRTANELQWNVQSLPHTGEHVQVAYTLSLDGSMVEQGIKTLDNVIDNGAVHLEDITNALVTVLTSEE